MMARDTKALLKKVQKRYEAAEGVASAWQKTWEDKRNYLAPAKGNFTGEEAQHRHKRAVRLNNRAHRKALRYFAAGMQSGMSSPASPWFKFGLPDGELAQWGPVRTWLDHLERLYRYVFTHSNFYGSSAFAYHELGAFDQAAVYICEHPKRYVHFHNWTMGTYLWAQNAWGDIDTNFRTWNVPLRTLVQRFGEQALSETLKKQWAGGSGKVDDYVKVIQCVMPREDLDLNKIDRLNMPWASIWFEPNANKPEHILWEGGHQVNPCLSIRYELDGEGPYATGLAEDNLDDVRMLQEINLSILRGEQLNIDPPMGLSDKIRNRMQLFPGGRTPMRTADEKPERLIDAVDTRGSREIKAELIQDISNGYFNHLFLSLIEGQESPEKTAYEVAMKEREKILMLSPLVERLQTEMFDPLFYNMGVHLDALGMIPPPPSEIPEGMPLKIEYISILAEAQQSVGLQAIERYIGFVGSMAQYNPAAWDNINEDKASGEYAELLNIPAAIPRSEDEIIQIRKQRVQDQKQAMAAEQAKNMAGATKDLSQTKVGDRNVLEALEEQMQ